jgi:hypothetical protein
MHYKQGEVVAGTLAPGWLASETKSSIMKIIDIDFTTLV